MTGYPSNPDFKSARIRREASEWLALLRSGQRTPELEARFRSWLEEGSEHRAAFYAVTQTWESLGPAGESFRADLRRRRIVQRSKVLALAACVVFAVAVAGWFGLAPTRTLETRHGEQRTVVLSDGSRVALNTDTKVLVRYLPHHRLIRLERGEAAFDVAHDSSRPFIVTAAGEDVTAVGTSFTVRMKGNDLSVTLAEGRLKLEPAASYGVPAHKATPVVLQAGQRWTPRQGVLSLDPAAVDASSAWRRGELDLKDVSLSDAVEEMNRYSPQPILLEVAHADKFKISGVFRIDDSVLFARTLASVYGLNVEERDNTILILGEPQPENNSAGKV